MLSLENCSLLDSFPFRINCSLQAVYAPLPNYHVTQLGIHSTGLDSTRQLALHSRLTVSLQLLKM